MSDIAGFFDGSAGITGAHFNVRSAAECATAEILVLDVCARRLFGGGRLFFVGVEMTGRCASTRLYFGLFPLFCALFFALFFPLAFSLAISMTFPVFGAPDAL
jgi:hypothetical protein